MPSDEDAELFREAVAGARPVRDTGRVPRAAPKPPPLPIQSLRDEDAALAEAMGGADQLSDGLEIGEAESFLRKGLPQKVLRDLQRGRWTVQDVSDLHGQRADDARLAVVQFLAQARRQGRRCVQLIHGKGHGSHGGAPVLRNLVRAWLMQRDEVLAYCDAPAGLGGSGAVIILLKAS